MWSHSFAYATGVGGSHWSTSALGRASLSVRILEPFDAAPQAAPNQPVCTCSVKTPHGASTDFYRMD